MVMPSKDKLNQLILQYFNNKKTVDSYKDEFVMVNSISLAAIHLIVIIRKRFAPYLSEIKNSEMALGYQGMLANKGSICISFKLGKIRMLFINCHLEAHNEGLKKRTQQWNQINNQFVLNPSINEMTIKRRPFSASAMACMPQRKS